MAARRRASPPRRPGPRGRTWDRRCTATAGSTGKSSGLRYPRSVPWSQSRASCWPSAITGRIGTVLQGGFSMVSSSASAISVTWPMPGLRRWLSTWRQWRWCGPRRRARRAVACLQCLDPGQGRHAAGTARKWQRLADDWRRLAPSGPGRDASSRAARPLALAEKETPCRVLIAMPRSRSSIARWRLPGLTAGTLSSRFRCPIARSASPR